MLFEGCESKFSEGLNFHEGSVTTRRQHAVNKGTVELPGVQKLLLTTASAECCQSKRGVRPQNAIPNLDAANLRTNGFNDAYSAVTLEPLLIFMARRSP